MSELPPRYSRVMSSETSSTTFFQYIPGPDASPPWPEVAVFPPYDQGCICRLARREIAVPDPEYTSQIFGLTLGDIPREKVYEPGEEVTVKEVISRKFEVPGNPVDAQYASYLVFRILKDVPCNFAQETEYQLKATQLKERLDDNKPLERSLSHADRCYVFLDIPSGPAKNTPVIVSEVTRTGAGALFLTSTEWTYSVRVIAKDFADIPYVIDKKLIHDELLPQIRLGRAMKTSSFLSRLRQLMKAPK